YGAAHADPLGPTPLLYNRRALIVRRYFIKKHYGRPAGAKRPRIGRGQPRVSTATASWGLGAQLAIFLAGAVAAWAAGAAAGRTLRLEEGALMLSGPPRLHISGPMATSASGTSNACDGSSAGCPPSR